MQRLVLGLTFVALLWAIGFVLFIRDLPVPADEPPIRVDGVVVYTGGGGARIMAAMMLFADGAGDRLLISGVHPDTSRERLSEFWDGANEKFDCCVDIGREALTTTGNAEELSDWAAQNEYQYIALVTSDYHMPRAIAATRKKMPDVTIYPYAVSSGYLDESGRPTSLTAWRKLAGEYSKFVLARVRSFFASLFG